MEKGCITYTKGEFGKRKRAETLWANRQAYKERIQSEQAAFRFRQYLRGMQRKNLRKRVRKERLECEHELRRQAHLQKVEDAKNFDTWAPSYNPDTGIVEDPSERWIVSDEEEDWEAPIVVETEEEDLVSSDEETHANTGRSIVGD